MSNTTVEIKLKGGNIRHRKLSMKPLRKYIVVLQSAESKEQ